MIIKKLEANYAEFWIGNCSGEDLIVFSMVDTEDGACFLECNGKIFLRMCSTNVIELHKIANMLPLLSKSMQPKIKGELCGASANKRAAIPLINPLMFC